MDINLNNVESDLNKSTNVNTDQASNTKYPSVKAVFDWATNLFFPKPTGTTAQYLRGDGTVATFPIIPDPSDFVEKSDFTSHSILAKQRGASDPVAVSIGNNEILGRKSGGGSDIEGLSVSDVKSLLNYTASDVGAVATNSVITGATKTKITYDAKGLVTAGADATTADIADSSNKRYVTDAQLTVIENTSGTNTGDNFILTGAPVQSNSAVGGVVRYYGFSDNVAASVETSRRTVITKDTIFKGFYLRTSGTQPITGSHIITVLKNGVATGITITIPSGSGTGVFSDTVNTLSAVAGDELSLEAVNNASTTSSIIVSYSLGVL
jgi:hypothetical protein